MRLPLFVDLHQAALLELRKEHLKLAESLMVCVAVCACACVFCVRVLRVFR